MNPTELLLHPVRLRILHAMSGGRVRTTAELCGRLPDVPKATMYRQVHALLEGGLLEVAGERRVHGAVERQLQLQRSGTIVDEEMAASMTLDDHRQGFAAAVAALVAEFNLYLDRDDADPTADLVGYRQIPMWLDRDELTTLIVQITDLLRGCAGNAPSPDRRRYLVSPIFFPVDIDEAPS